MSTVNYNDTVPAAPANYNNIKWQSDASGNISAYDPGGTWTSYTPSFTPLASMTASSVTATGEYARVGSICYFTFNCTATLGGTATNRVDVGLPASLPLVGSNNFMASIALAVGGGSYVSSMGYVQSAAPTVFSVFVNSGVPYTLGGMNVLVSGFYRCA